jgi:hypothetical protein
VKAGIMWVIGLLNPAGAFIKACKLIYDIVMFFVENGKRILDLINAIIDSVALIVQGSLTGAAKLVENALAKLIPITLGFLAALLGLSGITEKVQKIIQAIQAPINKAIDWVLDKAIALAKKLGIDKIVKKVKGGIQGAKDWAKDKAKKVKDKVTEKAKSVKERVMNWLGIKETYTNDSGESHTIQFIESGKKPQLIRASTPTPISTFLAAKRAEITNPNCPLSAAEKSQIQASISEAEQVILQVNQLTYPTSPPKEDDSILLRQANTLIKKLKDIVKKIDKNTVAIPPLVVRPGFSAAKAGSLSVKYLLKDHHQPGTEASEYGGDMHGATPILRSLRLLPHKWVNFHILNHNTGGLAVDSNLIPTPKDVNNEFKGAFENTFKTWHGASSVLWMEAKASYRSGDIFINTITVNGGKMKASGKDWIPDSDNQLPTFSATVAPPAPEGIPINDLPGKQDDIRELAKYTPITGDLLVLLSKIKPPYIASKEVLISILKTRAVNDTEVASKLSDYIIQIKSTNFIID